MAKKLLKNPSDRTPLVLTDNANLIVPHLHRCPPKPPWLYAYFKKHKKDRRGWCEWCDQPILPGQRKSPTRATWHLECVNEYRMLFDWKYMRRLIRKRDAGVCQSCGLGYDAYMMRNSGLLEVDHTIPLHRWPVLDMRDLTQETLVEWYAPWWPSNLQCLCNDCHRAKTAFECRARGRS